MKPKKRRFARGCVVCNEDHFARNHHSNDEILAAIRKKKESKQSLFAEEVALLAQDIDNDSSDDASLDDDDDSDNEFAGTAYTVTEVTNPINTRLELKLANTSFAHGFYGSVSASESR